MIKKINIYFFLLLLIFTKSVFSYEFEDIKGNRVDISGDAFIIVVNGINCTSCIEKIVIELENFLSKSDFQIFFVGELARGIVSRKKFELIFKKYLKNKYRFIYLNNNIDGVKAKSSIVYNEYENIRSPSLIVKINENYKFFHFDELFKKKNGKKFNTLINYLILKEKME